MARSPAALSTRSPELLGNRANGHQQGHQFDRVTSDRVHDSPGKDTGLLAALNESAADQPVESTVERIRIPPGDEDAVRAR